MDMWSLSFPGLDSKPLRDIRLVLTALPHDCVLRETQDDLMAILAWSFQALAAGAYPTERHDSQPWGAEDAWRAKKSGQALQQASPPGNEGGLETNFIVVLGFLIGKSLGRSQYVGGAQLRRSLCGLRQVKVPIRNKGKTPQTKPSGTGATLESKNQGQNPPDEPL